MRKGGRPEGNPPLPKFSEREALPSGRFLLALEHLHRFLAAIDDILVDDHFGDAFQRGQVEHRIEQQPFHDRPQAPRAGLALDGLLGDRFQRCLLYTSPSPRDLSTSRMPSSA